VAAQNTGASRGDNGLFSSPLARRIAKDAGVDIKSVAGSGPHGRVVKSDVEKAIASGGAKPASAAAPAAASAAPAAAPKGMSEDAVLKLFEQGSYELVPHDGMRKTIAKRLQESKQTIPHFYVSVDVELDALLALRAQINGSAPEKDGKPAYRLSVNDMVIKAMALALRDVPDANVSWTDTNMVKHKHADVGVAVSIPGGLITPIIRKAELKSLSAISNEMKDLGKRAKERKLKPEEYQGGTTAVSNMGMMGVSNFAAVVNPPHATILAVGAGTERVVVKKGQMVIVNAMTVTLSTDHRCVDGALGAELLGAFKRYIESPMGMLV
jgi:pyruvate dehydrogenase E2 component (dihydrolipoamide acetyltransferase)